MKCKQDVEVDKTTNLWFNPDTLPITHSKPLGIVSGGFCRSGTLMHQISLRMPLSLFQELAKQAAERGLPVTAYVRTQLAHSIHNPTNIHKTKKDSADAP